MIFFDMNAADACDALEYLFTYV